MKRAILLVLDGCGAGEAPDASEFGDLDHPATISHVLQANPGLSLPTLCDVGFLAACQVPQSPTGELGALNLGAAYGRLQEMSKGGKDSVTGHWEMAGIVTDTPFPTYPNGFPRECIETFQRAIGRETLGNVASSGTEIIARFGMEHLRTGCPIVYTSADSVFQLAAHETIVPRESLYEMCQIARQIFVTPNNVQRVIARPFAGSEPTGFFRTEGRRDFPVSPPENLCDRIGDVFGIGVVPELFAHRGFRPVSRTQSNEEHEALLFDAIRSDARLIWANFEDFDMKFGHRNDPVGFGRCLERFDRTLAKLIQHLEADDLLLLTADHGNDPTTPGTDHSREYVPMVSIERNTPTLHAPDRLGLFCVGRAVEEHLSRGESVLKD